MTSPAHTPLMAFLTLGNYKLARIEICTAYLPNVTHNAVCALIELGSSVSVISECIAEVFPSSCEGELMGRVPTLGLHVV